MDESRPTKRAHRAIHRSNVKIGVLTLLTIALAAATGIFLPGMLRPTRLVYQIIRRAGEDISGIDKGSEVSVGGIVRGYVTRVDSDVMHGEPRFVVSFEIEADPPIYNDAQIRIVRDVVSNRARIDFSRTGAPDASHKRLAPGNEIHPNSEEGDASLFLTPGSQRDLNEAWEAIRKVPDELGPIVDDGKVRLTSVIDSVRSFRDDYGDEMVAYKDRVVALIDRYSAIKARFTKIMDEWTLLRAEFDQTRLTLSDEGELGRVRARIATFIERRDLMAAEFRDLGTLLDGITDCWARLKESGTHIIEQFGSIDALREFREARADLSLAADQLLRLMANILDTAARAIVPTDSSRDVRAAALDDMSRTLLMSIDEARGAETALRALLDGGERFPAMLDEVDRFSTSLQRLTDIEQALWQSRVGGRAPGSSQRAPGR